MACPPGSTRFSSIPKILPEQNRDDLAPFRDILDPEKLFQPKIYPKPGCQWFSSISRPSVTPNSMSLTLPVGNKGKKTHELFNSSLPSLFEDYSSKYQLDSSAYSTFAATFSALPIFECHVCFDPKRLTNTSEIDPVMPLQHLLHDQWSDFDRFEGDDSVQSYWLYQMLSKATKPTVRPSVRRHPFQRNPPPFPSISPSNNYYIRSFILPMDLGTCLFK